MRRAEVITLVGGAAVAWPLVARAQQPERMRRIGLLMTYDESDPEGQSVVAAFREGLQKLGWAKGRNIRIDTRWGTERTCWQVREVPPLTDACSAANSVLDAMPIFLVPDSSHDC